MPTYEYRCDSCSLKFEVRKRFGENSGGVCPKCQGEGRRLFSAVPIIFKGSGFYVTDHRAKNSAGEWSNGSEEADKEGPTKEGPTEVESKKDGNGAE